MTSSSTGAELQLPCASPEEPRNHPCLGPARSPRKVKDKRQLTCAEASKGRVAEPRRARPGDATPLPHRPKVERRFGVCTRPDPAPGARDPAPTRRPARPSEGPHAGRGRPGGGAGHGSFQGRAGRREPETHRRCPRPHPPRAPGVPAGGGRGRGAATVAAGPGRVAPRAPLHSAPAHLCSCPGRGLARGCTSPMKRRQQAWLAPHS
ncbi:uncharacterized protein LOC144377787 [Ictidomys tridecemlineatus]